LRCLQTTFHLAQEMGKSLGRCEILQLYILCIAISGLDTYVYTFQCALKTVQSLGRISSSVSIFFKTFDLRTVKSSDELQNFNN
jgi:hypothetical protein